MPDLTAFVVTCAERAGELAETLARFRKTDWGVEPIIVMDNVSGGSRFGRINDTWRRAVKWASATEGCSLVIEDDVDLNVHVRHNLESWEPVSSSKPMLGLLYNGAALDPHAPDHAKAWGGQGLVFSQSMAIYVARHWAADDGFADTRIPRLASRAGIVAVHSPSLIQHVGRVSTWGGQFHQAADFDREWRA